MTEGARFRDDQLNAARWEAERDYRPEPSDFDYADIPQRKRIPSYTEEGLHESAYLHGEEDAE